MPIDVEKASGAELPALTFDYDHKTVILYALGVGAGAGDGDLKFCYENPPGLSVLPTFGVVPPFPALMSVFGVEGLEINPMMILHGEQYLEIRKQPASAGGKLTTRSRVARIYDKVKMALIELEAETVDETGDVVYFNRFGVLVRGEGGFGGERAPGIGNIPPDRAPDKVLEMKTSPDQALLYRLSGDPNPLHADPNFAAMAGFDRPILHGLCTVGFACRAVLKAYCDNEPERFKSVQVRFSKPVFPGETIVTEMWDTADGKILFQVKTAEHPDNVNISNAVVELND
ncbi:MAG: 3-alpha,7-alpha,12-alpha-trihydroxy-5-beta-cholest-24-enoyl-CoA hydratase [Candidatus Anoxymicrobium japonicum]|uniref:3-alpha,7-alpha, 12-alpha-trihydroxy-5-beta-cholest-24-enoyl-CoA hydratase n=1 Tax=Candidatus Anoxymicrobium japonicum TaxID=2013648 RepID=A0A2N3G6K1_9ACTN|nr:MAG: 3-alpha,7-alpha,12-alpha-trihydroxy-5-beta-cholest-24-enoyl-CoA hydratase [Candidatus Anoxymicrobium japonicum]